MPELTPEERLNELPLRAQVALAARCARRVQPLLRKAPAYSGAQGPVEGAIRVAEQFAQGELDTDFPTARTSAADAAYAANAAADAAAATGAAAYAAVAYAAVAYAAEAAAHAAAYAAHADSGAAAAAAADAADAAATAAETAAAAYAASAATRAEALADIAKLAELHLGTYPVLGEPIDPSEGGPLGPLWSQGVPDSMNRLGLQDESAGPARAPPHGSEPERLVLGAEVNEVADTEGVAGILADLGSALNAYHIAAGGHGLVIDEWELRVPESLPVEARGVMRDRHDLILREASGSEPNPPGLIAELKDLIREVISKTAEDPDRSEAGGPKGRSQPETAKGMEIRATAMEKLGRLEIERQGLIKGRDELLQRAQAERQRDELAPRQWMFELETERFKAKIERLQAVGQVLKTAKEAGIRLGARILGGRERALVALDAPSES